MKWNDSLRYLLVIWYIFNETFLKFSKNSINFSKLFPEAKLYYLIGADHILTLPKWREAKRLANLVDFVVVPRPRQKAADFPKPFRGQSLNGWPFEVSSSVIRQRLAIGLPIDDLVPAHVADALKKNNPY